MPVETDINRKLCAANLGWSHFFVLPCPIASALLEVTSSPWIWSENTTGWLYIPTATANERSGWIFIPRPFSGTPDI